ncbi:hypothetical protein ABW21_db0202864 [Orbilia brochopaga]|nr:hypothetical protein ABW21_db0202864 [Drechslerella brochopaga]
MYQECQHGANDKPDTESFVVVRSNGLTRPEYRYGDRKLFAPASRTTEMTVAAAAVSPKARTSRSETRATVSKKKCLFTYFVTRPTLDEQRLAADAIEPLNQRWE